jgi:exodeoxyribonuclease VII small subunit
MAESKIPADVAKMSFEEALGELQAVQFYERGAALKRHCEAKLRDAQEKVAKIVIGADGSVGSEPVDLG